MAGIDLAHAFYGLRFLSSEHAEVRGLLKSLNRLLDMHKRAAGAAGGRSSRGSKGAARLSLTAPLVLKALYGMRRMRSEDAEVRDATALLSRALSECMPGDGMPGECMPGDGMPGECMPGDGEQARRKDASAKSLHGRNKIPKEAITSALYGMQSMTGADPHTHTLLHMYSAYLETSDELYTPKSLSRAVFGLQRMQSTYPSVQRTLRALTRHICACRQPFSAMDVRDVLLGMENMHATDAAVADMLAAMVAPIESSTSLDESTREKALAYCRGVASGQAGSGKCSDRSL
jgi:hypothetical protein